MKKVLRKVLVILLVFVSLMFNVNAKEIIKLKECEYSDAYKAWLKLSDKEKENTFMPAVCKDAYTLKNYMLGNSATIPEKYDLRTNNYVNEVKDQGDTGSCWAFSTLTSIESNLLIKGLGKYNFSEGHMELATSNNLYTPNRITFNRKADMGANPLFSQVYLLNHWGPINETDLAFDYYNNVLNKVESINASAVESKSAIADVNETVILMNEQGACSDSAIVDIKNYILKNGAVNASLHMSAMYAENTVLNNTTLVGPYINGPYYYYDGTSYKQLGSETTISANAVPDHAVTIIGWDDTISASNFSTQPSRDGAWIIQNSYGEALVEGTTKIDMGDKGYYYVSYDDINICGMLGGYYKTDLDVPENAYYYDDLGFAGLGYESRDDILYQGSVFTKKSENTEVLKKVTFGSYETGVKYTVYFADNGSLENYIEIGKGTTDHFGYTTLELKETVEITSQKYSIVVKFEGMANKFIPVSAIDPENSHLNNLQISQGVTFLSLDGNEWADTASGEFNTTLRAYTNVLNKVDKPAETPGDDEVKDDGNVEVEKNDGTVIEGDKTEQSGNANPNEEAPKDDTVESPKTGIEDYVIILVGGILLVSGIYYYLNKKNIIKKI